MPLHPDLALLVALDEIDEAIAAAAQELARARAVLPTREDTVRAAEASLEDSRAALAQARAEERSVNREIRAYEDRKAAAERMLDSGMGDADAAERQLTQVGSILDELETRILLGMERQEALEAEIGTKQQAVDVARTALDEAREQVPPVIARHEAALAAAQARRPDALAALRRDLRSQYELKRQRKRRAVAQVRRGGCRSCNTLVAAQKLSDLRHGRVLLTCAGCDRWLVPEDPA